MELLNCASESKPSLQNLSSRGNHLLTFWLPSFSLSARTHTWQIVTYNLLSKSEYRRSQLLVVFFFFPAIKSTYATLGGNPLSSGQLPQTIKNLRDFLLPKGINFAINARNCRNWKTSSIQFMLFILLPCDVTAGDRACTVQQMTPLIWSPSKGSLIAPVLTHPAGVSWLVFHCPVNTLPRITIVPGCLGLKTLSRDRKYYWKRKSHMLSSNQPHSVYSGACVEFRSPPSPQGNFIPGGGECLTVLPH